MVKGVPIEMEMPKEPGEALSTGTPIKQPKPRRKAKVIQMKIAAKEEGFAGERFVDENPFEDGISGDADVLEITDFPDEMRECIQLEEELDRYFQFLSKLDRDELLAIVKYEVYNRVLMQQNIDLGSEKKDE